MYIQAKCSLPFSECFLKNAVLLVRKRMALFPEPMGNQRLTFQNFQDAKCASWCVCCVCVCLVRLSRALCVYEGVGLLPIMPCGTVACGTFLHQSSHNFTSFPRMQLTQVSITAHMHTHHSLTTLNTNHLSHSALRQAWPQGT